MRTQASVLAVAFASTSGIAACGSDHETVKVRTKPGPIVMRMPSESMEPTFQVREPFRVDPGAYESAEPKIGDIIAFHPPRGADLNECGAAHRPGQVCARPTATAGGATFVKRVVAGPGDRIRMVNGHVIRNGHQQDDSSYTKPCHAGDDCDYPAEATVPAGSWFVLGDNRGASDDSRFWGPIKTSWIVGKVLGH